MPPSSFCPLFLTFIEACFAARMMFLFDTGQFLYSELSHAVQ